MTQNSGMVKMKQNKSEIKKSKTKTTVAKISSGTVTVFDISGKAQGTLALPKEFFAQKVNKKLLAHAMRVYFALLHKRTASTKTRAEVKGGGRKPWRQKGTGRARAGSIRSPLWVGGGIVFGPKPNSRELTLPKKMKKAALISALSQKKADGQIKILVGLDKIQPKTKTAQLLLKKLEATGNTIFIIDGNNTNLKLATRNIPNVGIDRVENLNAFKVLSNNSLLIAKESISRFS